MSQPRSTDAKPTAADLLGLIKKYGNSIEKVLNAAGIHSVDDLKKLGIQYAIVRMVKRSPRFFVPLYSYVMIGAAAHRVWTHIPVSEKKKAKDFLKGLFQRTETKHGSASKNLRTKKKVLKPKSQNP